MRIQTALSNQSNSVTLLWKTPQDWSIKAVENLPHLMSDHAWCERKASGTCLSLLAQHLDFPQLAEPMIRLAREELEHFHLVYNFMKERSFPLLSEPGNAYAKQLHLSIRKGEHQLLDRLIVSALIETRSCERLGLIADILIDEKLKDFYSRLEKSEARHSLEFVEIAESIYGVDTVQKRLSEFLVFESEAIQLQPFQSRIH